MCPHQEEEAEVLDNPSGGEWGFAETPIDLASQQYSGAEHVSEAALEEERLQDVDSQYIRVDGTPDEFGWDQTSDLTPLSTLPRDEPTQPRRESES